MKNYKAFIIMLILAFSLSPCSVKRDFLNIFDIQHTSGLNKVKITNGAVSSCIFSGENSSSKTVLSKTNVKLKDNSFLFNSNTVPCSGEEKTSINKYSGHSTGNSPPKYILFKKLKLHLA
ncbi:hypothetical protein ACQWU4_04995 [Chryseobacterium sp. MIQD13]|uniref:hypothetical protein n=1 Tax=Chryseobacterium sp. MIQD13 TaxID=3422310 RepID=UPI003D27719C